MEARTYLNLCQGQKERSSFHQDISGNISAVSKSEVIDLTDEVECMDHSALEDLHHDLEAAESTKGTEEHLEEHGIAAERTQLGFYTGFNGDSAHTIDLTDQDNILEMSDGSEDSDEEVYECRICGSSFSDMSNLLAHTLAHTPAHTDHSDTTSDRGDSEITSHSEYIQNGEEPLTISHVHNSRTEVIKAEEKPEGNSDNIIQSCNDQHTDEQNSVMGHSNVFSNDNSEVIDLTDDILSQSSEQSSRITDTSKDAVANSLINLQNCVNRIEGSQLQLHTPETTNHYLKSSSQDSDLVPENHVSVDADGPHYTCKKCFRVFKGKAALGSHMILHNDKRPYECLICKATFKTKGYLEGHMVRHDHKMPVSGKGTAVCKDTYKCKTCAKRFTTIASLHHHNKMHIQQRPCQEMTNQRAEEAEHLPYLCRTCGRMFTTMNILLSHAKWAHNDDRPLKCFECEKTFMNTCWLRRHKCKVEPPVYWGILPAKPFVVDNYQENVLKPSMVDNYQEHVIQPSIVDNYQENVTQPSYVDNYQENVTQPSYVDNYQELVIQPSMVDNYQKNVIQPFMVDNYEQQMPQPSTSTTNRKDEPKADTLLPTQTSQYIIVRENSKHSTLKKINQNGNPNGKNHGDNCEEVRIALAVPRMVANHDKKEKQYKRRLCPEEWPSEIDLNDHMSTHTKPKLFSCDVCDMGFNTEFMLKLHESSHREGLPYSCTRCGRGFRQESSLTAHLAEHHMMKPSVNRNPLKCELCGKCAKSQFKLQKHKKVHHFRCDVCGKAFKTKDECSTHVRTHRDSLPPGNYQCTICGKSLGTTASLYKHMRLHCEDMPFKCTICERSFKIKGNLHIHMAKFHQGYEAPELSETSKETAEEATPPTNENMDTVEATPPNNENMDTKEATPPRNENKDNEEATPPTN